MRNLLVVVGLIGALGFWSGCAGKDRPPGIDTSYGGKPSLVGNNKGGSKMVEPSGGEGGGGGAGDVAADPLAPLVTITSPTQLDDPNGEGVVIGAEVTVTCQVKQSEVTGAAQLDATTIKLALLDASGEVVSEKAAVPGENADEYTNTFSLTTADAGRISFRCAAQDTKKRVGSDKVSTFLDKGPLITFVSPEPDTFLPLTAVLAIEFTVEAAPLADGDEGAAVDEVSLDIAGTPFPLSEAETSPGTYHLDVNLADPTLFNPAPNGPLPLTVKATNQRMPTAVQATVTQPMQVDGAAPTLQITSPVDKAVVGGNVVLTFKATDTISGVDPATVVVSLNTVETHYDATADAWGYAMGTFSYKFDSRQVKNSKVQITVNVRASDKVGNAAGVATELLYLDNVPPSVDLDPANVRTYAANHLCSHAFDPVGPASLNDLQLVQAAGTPRAIVWEETNTIPEIPVSHFSGVEANTARVYLRAANASPLVVDTDNDGICDDVSNVDDPAAVTLGPLARAGNAWQISGEDTLTPTMASLARPDFACVNAELPPSVGNPPPSLCTGQISDMYQVIEHPLAKEPVIYARGATVGAECTGTGWEFSTFLAGQDGWVCFAARAVDKVGNVGVSRPIRVCVDDPSVAGTPSCAISSADPPSCTDGCMPPPRWGNVALLQQ